MSSKIPSFDITTVPVSPKPPKPPKQYHSSSQNFKKRSAEEQKSLLNRLNRIEGQIRGIRGMVEGDVYCPDILIQVAAATAALNGFTRELLDQHIRTCVASDLEEGNDEKVDELLDVLQRLMR